MHAIAHDSPREELTPASPPMPRRRYLICEADESVDKPDIGCGRFVTRGDPH